MALIAMLQLFFGEEKFLEAIQQLDSGGSVGNEEFVDTLTEVSTCVYHSLEITSLRVSIFTKKNIWKRAYFLSVISDCSLYSKTLKNLDVTTSKSNTERIDLDKYFAL